ncbi:MAG TPA: radical SAM protein [Vicinamibacterales bacterium]|nr:radical SAM protein [Vicinamibacterales bacterium]
MDILLAHGYFLALDEAEQRVMRPHPPLGLLYLSSHLKQRGFDVGVFDSTFSTIEQYVEALDRHKPPVVGIAVNLMTKRNALRMMAIAKRKGARVVIGGPDPPHHAECYLEAGADVVVIGEGEETVDELLSSGDDLSAINGIVFRAADGSIVRTPPRALLPELDAQPPPDRDAIDLPAYLEAWRERHGTGTVSLITARGCPYTCTWCSRSVFGETHRRRSVVNVADEVEAIVDRYHPERLWYADDVFAIHKTWTVNYARELERRHIRLPFECISRAERIDDDVAAALASLGCFRVWIGSESGSQRVLDAMKRKVTVDQVRESSQRLRRHGIQVGMFIMLGYDGENMTDLQDTVQHLKRTSPDVFLTTVSYPIKGTPYYDQVADRLRPQPWTDHTDRDLVVRGRPVRTYYDFARRWMTAEVARDQHWRDGRYASAARSASSALVGRLGMAVTAHWRER